MQFAKQFELYQYTIQNEEEIDGRESPSLYLFRSSLPLSGWYGKVKLRYRNAVHSFRILLQSHLLRAWNTTWSRALDNNAVRERLLFFSVLAKSCFGSISLAEKRRYLFFFFSLLFSLTTFSQCAHLLSKWWLLLLMSLMCCFLMLSRAKCLYPLYAHTYSTLFYGPCLTD